MSNIAKLPSTESPAGYVAIEVRAQLARHGWSQSRLALVLGTTQAAVSRRLTGDVAFDAAELSALADAFGMHPGDFFPQDHRSPAEAPALRLTEDEERVILALRSTAPSVLGTKKATRGGALGGLSLPDLDSNQEPVGYTPDPESSVISLDKERNRRPQRSTTSTVEAIVTPLRRVASA